MPEQTIRGYLVCPAVTLGTVHSEQCHHVPAEKIGWLGPYASRGAAIDILLNMDMKPWECKSCIKANRVNAE